MTTPTQRKDIERKYEMIYSGVDATVKNFIAHATSQGQSAREIYGVLKPLVSAAWVYAMQGKNRSREEQAEFFNSFVSQPMSWTERGVEKSGTLAEYELSISHLYAEVWRDHAPKDCDLAVELGCGWGHRLVDMYFAGLNTQFFGGDRSDHSRNLVKGVTALFPEMKADWFRFDFLKPDFTALPDSKRILIITCHAIEQVTVLGRGFFDTLLARFPGAEIVGAHVEPIASQIDPTRAKEAAYAEMRKYNLDLYPLVKAHPALEIVEANAALADSNDGNPGALLIWKTKAA